MSEELEPTQRMQRMLDRLILAGWLKDSARVESPQGLGPGSSEIGFTWTPYGLQRLRQFLTLVNEIEQCSGPMNDPDWQQLKMIAVTAHNQARNQGAPDSGDGPQG
jgi:hypothetical protein